MENLRIATRSLSRSSGNVIKIVCLALGLVMGLLLVAKVVFESSYDNFYPDAERIFAVKSNVERGEDGTWSFFETSGGIAPGIKAEVAGVEAATRMVNRGIASLETPGGEKWEAPHIGADRELFDVLPRRVIAGAGSEALAVTTNILVSRSLAEKMGGAEKTGGAAVGETVWLNGNRDNGYTIAGIFEDLPDNTHQMGYDIITSLEDDKGAYQWSRGDRYLGYVKLAPAVNYRTLVPAIRKMQERHQDVEADLKAGNDLHYSLFPLRQIHSDQPESRRNILILSILAIVVLAAAVMNYVLVDIASVPNKAEGVAARRCYGARKRDIVGMIFTESLLHVLLSLGLAVVIAIVAADFIEHSFEVSLPSLLSLPATILTIASICVAILVIAVAVPANILTGVPVAAAFRSFKMSGRVWKLSLLGVQFALSVFIVLFLVSIQRQYSMMLNDDPGYNYSELLRVGVRGLTDGERNLLVGELEKMPQVKGVAATDGLPYNRSGLGGNNVVLPGQQEQINIYDPGVASVNYLDVMEIPIVEGTGFTAESANESSVVSRTLADRIKGLTGWESVVGRTMTLPIHGESTIVGVYDNLLVGDMITMDDRPSAIFLFTDPENPGMYGVRDLIVRLNEFSSDNIAAVQAVLSRTLPDNELYVSLMKDDLRGKYEAVRRFRSNLLAASLIILIIAMAGLVGFVYNETNRRSAEIAIRKIHGATSNGVLQLLGVDIGRIASIALVPGAVGAYFAADRWMQSFVEKASLPIAVFIAGCLALLALIVALTLFNTLRIAHQNPVVALQKG